MKNLLLSIIPLFLLLVACVDVPKTTIRVPTANGTVVIKAPKDSTIAGLKANFEKGTVSIDSYQARMNPDVVSASAAGQVELIKAYGDLANSMVQMGMRAFAASQGIPMAGPAPQSQPTTQVNQTITTEQLNAIIENRAQQLAAARTAQATNTSPSVSRQPRNRPSPAAPTSVSTNAPPPNP